MLVGEGAGEAGEAGEEEEVVVLWRQLAVSEVCPGGVAVVAVALVVLAVAIALGVVDCVVGCASSPLCDRRKFYDYVSKFSF